VSTAYFWIVSITGFLVVTIGLVVLFATDRRKEARRRAEINQAMVAMTGAILSVRPALEQMGEAFGRAAKQMAAFGEAFQKQEGQHR